VIRPHLILVGPLLVEVARLDALAAIAQVTILRAAIAQLGSPVPILCCLVAIARSRVALNVRWHPSASQRVVGQMASASSTRTRTSNSLDRGAGFSSGQPRIARDPDGLAVRQIAEAHAGSVAIEAARGGGSSFHLRLAERGAPPPEAGEPPRGRPTGYSVSSSPPEAVL
jgi:hypothetical protein